MAVRTLPSIVLVEVGGAAAVGNIGHVRVMVSGSEMFGINAGRVIAGMKNEVIGGETAVGEFVGHAVSAGVGIPRCRMAEQAIA